MVIIKPSKDEFLYVQTVGEIVSNGSQVLLFHFTLHLLKNSLNLDLIKMWVGEIKKKKKKRKKEKGRKMAFFNPDPLAEDFGKDTKDTYNPFDYSNVTFYEGNDSLCKELMNDDYFRTVFNFEEGNFEDNEVHHKEFAQEVNHQKRKRNEKKFSLKRQKIDVTTSEAPINGKVEEEGVEIYIPVLGNPVHGDSLIGDNSLDDEDEDDVEKEVPTFFSVPILPNKMNRKGDGLKENSLHSVPTFFSAPISPYEMKRKEDGLKENSLHSVKQVFSSPVIPNERKRKSEFKQEESSRNFYQQNSPYEINRDLDMKDFVNRVINSLQPFQSKFKVKKEQKNVYLFFQEFSLLINVPQFVKMSYFASPMTRIDKTTGYGGNKICLKEVFKNASDQANRKNINKGSDKRVQLKICFYDVLFGKSYNIFLDCILLMKRALSDHKKISLKPFDGIVSYGKF